MKPILQIGAIIQARMGSTRLPGKTLRKLKGKTVLSHIIDRTSRSKYINKIIVATTKNEIDNKIESSLYQSSAIVFRGDEDNVLERFYYAAKMNELDLIVRITADDPLKDPSVMDKIIEIMVENPRLDYCSNTIIPTFPEGIDVEVFTFSSLEKAYREAVLDSEKEHVTPYIWKNPKKFSIQNYTYSRDLSSWRWTLDNEEDWLFIQKIYNHFYQDGTFFGMEEVIPWLEKHPEIRKINQNTVRNEGYIKSINKEKKDEV